MRERVYLPDKRDGGAAQDKGAREIVPGSSLEARWQQLCSRFLPAREEESIWRMSRAGTSSDPAQGWKIHISATVLSANLVLQRVAPYLRRRGILFKAPTSLSELVRLNCGLFYGYTQVGKFITIYPRTTEEALTVARHLHKLTYKLPGPLIPFDIQFQAGSPVYYRYGSFVSLEMKRADGERLHAMHNPAGELVPDVRDSKKAFPDWVNDPFQAQRVKAKGALNNPLKTTIRAYEALSQRGKGGVYRALDLSVVPARACILKEGRRHGETDWDGRDGCWRVRHEARVLTSLSAAGVCVPKVYMTFKVQNHFYLVTEFVEGIDLQSLLAGKRKRIKLNEALQFGFQIAKLLEKIHAMGWVWRDCKPLNLLVTANNILRPVDFEGACRARSFERTPWGTNGYVPPEWNDAPSSRSKIPVDLYALGATLHQLMTGRLPVDEASTHLFRKARRIPAAVREIVLELLDEDPHARPDARVVSKVLGHALKNSLAVLTS